MCFRYQADVFIHYGAISRRVPATPMRTRCSFNISNDKVCIQLPRGLKHHAIVINDSG
jgi:hypothetical protein